MTINWYSIVLQMLQLERTDVVRVDQADPNNVYVGKKASGPNPYIWSDKWRYIYLVQTIGGEVKILHPVNPATGLHFCNGESQVRDDRASYTYN